MQKQHAHVRSRETSPAQDSAAPLAPCNRIGVEDARQSLRPFQHNLGRSRVGSYLDSLEEASFQAQEPEDSHKSWSANIGFAPALRRSLSENDLRGQTRQLLEVPPPNPNLGSVVSQLRAELCALRCEVRQLVRLQSVASKHQDSFTKHLEEQLGEQEVHHNNNNNNTNNNDHTKTFQESGLSSLDLDQYHPELDLDERLSFSEPNMLWEPSLASNKRDNLRQQEPKKKKVTFQEGTFAACNEQGQNNKNKQELRNNNDKKKTCKTTQPCRSELQQGQKSTKKAWNDPSRMQQQPATSSEKELEDKQSNNYNLGEEQCLGSLESETQATTALQSRFLKNKNMENILGQETKNKASWGILIDTGAAISVAPMGFASSIELSPVESTLQLRNVQGQAIRAFGRRTVNLIGSELSMTVSFVIAEVEQPLLGMDIFEQEQLGIQRSNQEYHLVNNSGGRTQLQKREQHLYLEACSEKTGLTTSLGSSSQEDSESLLDDKVGTEVASGELACMDVLASGGAPGLSLPSGKVGQHRNRTTLGATTALGEQGAKKKKKRKKPSAQEASQEHTVSSFEQIGQEEPAAKQLRNSKKTSLIEEIKLAAGGETLGILSKMDAQELSLRILLTLSLGNQWQVVTARARDACSEEVLGQQLRSLGLEQNRINNNIFSGDELVVMIDQSSLLIGGNSEMQECLFLELSAAMIALEEMTKLDPETPLIFMGKILEYEQSSNSISLRVPESFYHELFQQHELDEDAEAIDSLDQELNHNNATQQLAAWDASRQELYKTTVGELVKATACRPDLGFETHRLTQSLNNPTRESELQLRKVLGYIKGTLHYAISLHPNTQLEPEEAKKVELVAFSATAWEEEVVSTSIAYLSLWGVPLATSYKTSGAENQAQAELHAVRLASGLASFTKQLMQQLCVQNLDQLVHIRLRVSAWNELVEEESLAEQLGLSRRNKHIELDGQMQLSRVLPYKNLAEILTNTASEEWMLAKLRLYKRAAETGALSTVRCEGRASFCGSSLGSFLVGMLSVVDPPMARKQLRKLDQMTADSFGKPFESLPKSLARLTLQSLSYTRASLQILHSLSLPRRSLLVTLESLSLMIEEQEKIEQNKLVKWRAGTNSFSTLSFQKPFKRDLSNFEQQEQNALKEAGTNSFSVSFLQWILSLTSRLLGIFQFCSALFLGTSGAKSFQIESLNGQLCRNQSLISKSSFHSLLPACLNLGISLSLESLGSINCSFQQQDQLQAVQLSSQQLDQERIKSLERKRSSLRTIQLLVALFLFSLAFNSYSSFSTLREQELDNHNEFTTTFLERELDKNNELSPNFWKQELGENTELPNNCWAEELEEQNLQNRALQTQLQENLSNNQLLTRSLNIATFTTRTSSTPSSHRSASMRSLQTSFRRLASASTLATTSFQPTSSLRTTLFCFSLVINNLYINNSFDNKKVETKDELQQNFLEQELEKVLANKTCSLGPYDHLEQNLWQIPLQELSLQQNNQEQQTQLSATVPDTQLCQLHLSQLCPEDPDSAFSRQLPEEPWSASGLRTAAWPAAVQPDHLSFSKKTLSEQDLSNISLDKFFSESFGQQLSEQQLQNNLSTDQRQLHHKQLHKNTFQQLSLEHPSFRQKTLHKELATTFAKTSLIDNLVFQNFFFATLALKKVASEQLGENNLDKKQLSENNLYKKQLEENTFTQTEEACKEQLLTTGSSQASLTQQLFSTSLVQTSEAKAASQPDLLHRELPEEELSDKNLEKNNFATHSLQPRTSTSQLQKNQLEEENFTANSFEALGLPSFTGTACTEALLQEQLLQQHLFSRTFSQDSFSVSSLQEQSFSLENFQPDSFPASSLTEQSFRSGTFQTAAWQTGPSDRQLQKQQLDRRNLQQQQLGRNKLQDRSFRQNTFANNSFQKHSFDDYTFEKTSFTDKSLAAQNFEESSFAELSFNKSSLETSSSEQSFAEKLAEKSFEANFTAKSFEKNRAEQSFTRKSFAETTLHKETFAEQSFQQSSFAGSSFHTRSLVENSLAASSFTRSASASSSLSTSSFKKSFDNKSFDKTSFDNKSFDEKSFDKENFATSSFTPNSSTKSSLEESSFRKSSLQERSLGDSSLATDSLASSSFKASSLRKSSFRPSTFQRNSLAESSFTEKSFKKPSFEEDTFPQETFSENSFENSLKTESFGSYSFQDSSFQRHSFTDRSFNTQSFQTRTSPTELLSLQARPLTPELSSFELRTLPTELWQRESPTLPRELRQLKGSFETPASNFELALRSFCRRSFSNPCWERAYDNLSQRGSAKQGASPRQLDLV